MSYFKAMRVFPADDGQQEARVVQLSEADLPDGEVTIQGQWSGVNFKDALAVTGAGRILRHLPMTPGIDVAGTVVVSTHPDCQPGDAVLVTGCGLGEAHDGGFAGLTRVPADWVLPIPDGLDAERAMLIGTAGFTAGMALLRMEQNGQQPDLGPILVNGATGGVGSFAIRLFSRAGYQVVAATGKPDQEAYLRRLGAAEILDTGTIDVGKRPLEKALWGGAVDSLGGEPLTWLTRTVQPQGSIAAVGLAAGIGLQTTVMPFILRGVSLLGINSVTCPVSFRLAVWQRLAELLQDSDFETIRSAVIGLDDLPGYCRRMLDRETTGRTLVRLTQS